MKLDTNGLFGDGIKMSCIFRLENLMTYLKTQTMMIEIMMNNQKTNKKVK